MTAGTRTPFVFGIADVLGVGLYAWALARILGTDRPVYAALPSGMVGGETPTTLEDLAARRIEELRTLRPEGPYAVGGFCGKGGMLAFEMGRQLVAAGERVELIALIDTFPPVRGFGRSRRARLLGASADWPGRLRRPPARALYRRSISAVQGLLRRREPGAQGDRSGVAVAQALAQLPYRGGRYDGRLLVLWPEDEPSHPSYAEFARGWSRLAPNVEMARVPGTHAEAVTTRIADLAAVLGEALDEIDQGSRSTA